ncbi:MAG: glycosyltransferase [Nitrospiraceae bacterium]|nr:glycosyltransferase [Nitrospiraceae bacterium]
MSVPNIPSMSVVIATPDNFEVIRHTISCLARQTVRRLLEIVIVAPSRVQLKLNETSLPDPLTGFAQVQIVEVGTIRSIGRANAAGIRHATAPVIALAEDHCFPDPQWAENLIKAHRGPWAAVGPAVRNANPKSAVSWADLFIGYGPWLSPTIGREADFLPGHNTSYKRAHLLAYGKELESMMEAETLLHWDLRKNGHRLFIDPSVQVAHLNFSLWRSWLPVQFYNGRLFAGARVRKITQWKRALFIAGSPVIPGLRLWRIWRDLQGGEQRRRFLFCAHALIIGLILDGVGQMVGYAAGVGRAVDQVARFEFHRLRHIRNEDRRDLSLT